VPSVSCFGDGHGTIAPVRGPPITITCDCGEVTRLAYGERWTCGSCGKTWDTNQIPRHEYASLVRSTRLYGLVAIGPPVALAAVFIPLTVVYGARFAYLLFAFVLAYALLVVPPIRRRANRRVREAAPRWSLRPE
jgi:hypothetical protein